MQRKRRVIKVAAIQPDMIAGKLGHNTAASLRLTWIAISAGAQLIVLPELFMTGFDYDCIAEHPASRTERCLRELRKVARESGTIIVAGSVVTRKAGSRRTPNSFNTCHVIGGNGRTKAIYHKMHPFPLMNEHLHILPGKSQAIANTVAGKIGPCICFDIRFPEVARRLALMGAEIMTVPAEFPHPRLDHWRTLLRARAIENQFFVIASNRVGKDVTGHYFGHSMIVGPGGDVIAEASEEEETLMAEIDLGEVAAARKAISCLDRINPAIQIKAPKKAKR